MYTLQKCGLHLLLCLCLLPLCGCHFAASGQNAQGVRLFEQGQYSSALQQFQQAIASDPKNAEGYYNLAATSHQLGKERNDQNLLAQSESLYNQCLDLNPNHVDCHRGLGVLLVETNRPDRAFALLRNWATSAPTLAEAKVELARLHQEFGDAQTAQKFLEDAIQQDPNSSRAWLALGEIRESAEDYQQALVDYQRSFNLNTTQVGVRDRIAALNRRLSGVANASSVATSPGGAAGTRLAQPGPISRGRY